MRQQVQRFAPMLRQPGAATQTLQHGQREFLVHRVVFHQQHLCVQVALDRAWHRHQRCRSQLPSQYAHNAIIEIRLAHRPQQIRTDAGRTRRALRVATRAQHNQRQPGQRQLRADRTRQFNPVHTRQLVVDQRQIIGRTGRRRRAQPLDALRAAAGRFMPDPGRRQLMAERLLIDAIVNDDQRLAADRVQPHLCGGGERGRHWLLRQPQRKPEGGAAAHRALHTDGAAHFLDQLFADRQAQPGAAVLARRLARRLGKRVENALALIGSEADPGVADLKPQQHRAACPIGVGQRRHPHQHIATRAELDRIAGQIEQNLAQPAAVAHQQQRQLHRQRTRKVEAFPVRAVRQGIDHVFHQIAQMERPALEFQPAGLDSGELQNVVDHAEQGDAGALHRFSQAALLRRKRGAKQQFGHAQHPIHRGANLMAHGGHKIALGAARRLRRIARQAQLMGALCHLPFQPVAVLRQFTLNPLARCDVGQHHYAANMPAIVAEQRRGGNAQINQQAVVAAPLRFMGLRDFFVKSVAHRRILGLADVGQMQLAHLGADCRRLRNAKQPCSGVVPAGHDPVKVAGVVRLSGLLDNLGQQAVARLAQAQLLHRGGLYGDLLLQLFTMGGEFALNLFARRYVAHKHDAGNVLAACVEHRRGRHLHIDQAARLGVAPGFVPAWHPIGKTRPHLLPLGLAHARHVQLAHRDTDGLRFGEPKQGGCRVIPARHDAVEAMGPDRVARLLHGFGQQPALGLAGAQRGGGGGLRAALGANDAAGPAHRQKQHAIEQQQ